MYESGLLFQRTLEEKSDQLLSWSRDDTAFFAAGACHILAYAMQSLSSDRKREIICVTPTPPFTRGLHVYVLEGEWAFDFNGWTKEAELLTVSKSEYSKRYPGWQCERLTVQTDLETLCDRQGLRLPSDYQHAPWDRALKFINRFGSKPTTELR